jgi:hypothetical protein
VTAGYSLLAMSSPPDAIIKLPEPAKPRPMWTKVTDHVGLVGLLVLAAIVVALCFTIAAPVYMTSYRNSVASDKSIVVGLHKDKAGSWYPETGDCDPDSIQVKLTATQFVAGTASIKFHVNLGFGKEYTSSDRLKLPEPNTSLSVEFSSTKKTYRTGNQKDSFDIGMSIETANQYGTHAFYPFDVYEEALVVDASIVSWSKADGLKHAPASICVTMVNMVPSFTLALLDESSVAPPAPPSAPAASNSEDDEDYDETDESGANTGPVYNDLGEVVGQASYVVIHYRMSRTTSTKVFSIWINVLMWTLGSCMLGVVIDNIFLRPRDPLVPLTGVATGLLFAMPGVRGLQPDVPAMGAAVDMLGFWWAQTMCALAVVMLMCYVASAYKPK